jgi:hypothetical protein
MYLTQYPSLLSFELDSRDSKRRILQASPQALFRPEGLWVWEADESTLIHQISIGLRKQLIIRNTPIPALFFKAGMSYAEFNELVKKNDEGHLHPMKGLPLLPSHQKIRLEVAAIGNQIFIDVEGPLAHVVMWGVTAR